MQYLFGYPCLYVAVVWFQSHALVCIRPNRALFVSWFKLIKIFFRVLLQRTFFLRNHFHCILSLYILNNSSFIIYYKLFLLGFLTCANFGYVISIMSVLFYMTKERWVILSDRFLWGQLKGNMSHARISDNTNDCCKDGTKTRIRGSPFHSCKYEKKSSIRPAHRESYASNVFENKSKQVERLKYLVFHGLCAWWCRCCNTCRCVQELPTLCVLWNPNPRSSFWLLGTH